MLAVNRDASIADYYQRGPCGVVWSPVFIRDIFVDDSILTSFLNNGMRLHTRTLLMWCLGISILKEFSLLNLITLSSFLIPPSPFKLVLLGGSLGKFFGKI